MIQFVRPLVVLLLFAFCGLAQAATSANLSTSGQILTDNSRVSFADILPPEVELTGTPIYINLFFPGKDYYHMIVPVRSDRGFAADLVLKYGPGLYRAEVNYTKAYPSEPGSFSTLTLDTFTINNSDPLDETYRMPSDKVESDHPIIQNLAAQIISTAGATTELQKAKALHDWVAENIVYDRSECSRIESPGTGDIYLPEAGYLVGSATYTLKRKTGVCEDYSVLFAALARASGLQAQVIHGIIYGPSYGNKTEEHAWNRVFADGQWIAVDTTWDAGQPAGQKYFNPTPSTFALDHLQEKIETE